MAKFDLTKAKKAHQEIIDKIKKEKNFQNIVQIKQDLKDAENKLKNAKSLSDFALVSQMTNNIYKTVAREKAVKSWEKPDEVAVTINVLKEIEAKKNGIKLYGESYTSSSAILIEWMLYRALGSLFGNKAIFNGVSNDAHTLPLSVAGGKQPDLVVEFSDFILVLEVTLSEGQRQYDTETEPVTRHLAEIQQKHPNKEVYGLFVARNILPNVVDYFLIHHAFHKHPISNKNILLVPMRLDIFIDLYEYMIQSKKSEAALKTFFETFENNKKKNTCNSCNRANITLKDFETEVFSNFQQMIKDL